jgi:hypothetical protein
MSNKDGGGVKQQHYLPDKAYLDHFTDDKGKLHAYRFEGGKHRFFETATHFQTTARNLGKEGYIYESPDMPMNALEQALQAIEDVYRKVLEDKILQQKPLTANEEEMVTLFVSTMHGRVPAQRSHLNGYLDQVEQMGRQISHAHGHPEAGDRFAAEVDEARQNVFADSIAIGMQTNPFRFCNVCILTIDPTFDESFFLVGDNPVSVVDFADANTFYGLKHTSKTIEIVVPITSSMALFLNNAGLDGYKQIDAFYVDEINHRSFMRAKEFVLADKQLDEKFYDRITKHFPQSLVLRFIHKPRGKFDKTYDKVKKARKKGAAK